MTVKKWLIKKLGGYTADEYHTINRMPFQKVIIDRKNVEKLKSTVVVSRDAYFRGGVSQKELILRDLAVQMLPFVKERMTVIRRDDDGSFAGESIAFDAFIYIVKEK